MKFLKNYILNIANGKVYFGVESTSEFKTYGVALLDVSLYFMYGDNNLIIENERHIEFIKARLEKERERSMNSSQFFNEVEYAYSWQNELYVEMEKDQVYIEKWSLCTRLTLSEYLELFKSIQDFLLRWRKKEQLVQALKDIASSLIKDQAMGLVCNDYLLNDTDLIRIYFHLNKLDDFDRFLSEIEFPLHMTD